MQLKQIELHKQRDFGSKLNVTIEFVKRNFKPLYKSIIYIAGPFLLLGSLLMTSVFNYSFQSMGNPTGTPPDADMFFSLGIKGIGSFVFLLLASVALISVVYEFLKLYEKKGSGAIEVEEVYGKVKSSFWNVLGTVFLYVLLVIAIYIALLIPAFAFGALGGAFAFMIVIVVMVGLVYFFIASSLIFIIRAYENVGFITALTRSLKLIKGKWWSTFGLLFVIGLIQGVVSSIFMIPYYVNTIISTMHTVETGVFQEPSQTTIIVNQVLLLLYFLLSYLMYALPLLGIAFQYFNLREMKEATGLIDKIDAFEDLSNDSKDEDHY